MTSPIDQQAVNARVARNIKAARKRRGIKQPWLAAQIGVTFQQVQKYESGKNRITIGRLVAISEALGCHLYALVFAGAAAEEDNG